MKVRRMKFSSGLPEMNLAVVLRLRECIYRKLLSRVALLVLPTKNTLR